MKKIILLFFIILLGGAGYAGYHYFFKTEEQIASNIEERVQKMDNTEEINESIEGLLENQGSVEIPLEDGGNVTLSDLFSQTDSGVYVPDSALIEQIDIDSLGDIEADIDISEIDPDYLEALLKESPALQKKALEALSKYGDLINP